MKQILNYRGGVSQLENSINTINHNILALHRQLNFIQTLLLKNSSLNAIFDSIYETNLWVMVAAVAQKKP